MVSETAVSENSMHYSLHLGFLWVAFLLLVEFSLLSLLNFTNILSCILSSNCLRQPKVGKGSEPHDKSLVHNYWICTNPWKPRLRSFFPTRPCPDSAMVSVTFLLHWATVIWGQAQCEVVRSVVHRGGPQWPVTIMSSFSLWCRATLMSLLSEVKVLDYGQRSHPY